MYAKCWIYDVLIIFPVSASCQQQAYISATANIAEEVSLSMNFWMYEYFICSGINKIRFKVRKVEILDLEIL